MGNSHSRRGKEFESRINKVNLEYRLEKKALIHRIEVPMRVTKQGIIPQKSTVDYIGSIGPEGKAIAFDAKETIVETRFDLSNIKQHQKEFLRYWDATGGKSGFLIWFKSMDPDHAFWVPVTYIIEFENTETRKSIPYKNFREEWQVPIDNYLEL